jgi:aspartate racemase
MRDLDHVEAVDPGEVVRLQATFGESPPIEVAFHRVAGAEQADGVLVPDEPDRTTVHDVIYDELVRGVVREQSKLAYLEVIERLRAAGAEGVIAGCTEIELLVGADDVAVAWFPATRLHAEAAVEAALAP